MLWVYDTPLSHDSDTTKEKCHLMSHFFNFNDKVILLHHDDIITLSFPTKDSTLYMYQGCDDATRGKAWNFMDLADLAKGAFSWWEPWWLCHQARYIAFLTITIIFYIFSIVWYSSRRFGLYYTFICNMV